MNFKFDTCVQRVHPSKSPLKIWEKMQSGRIQGLPKFFCVHPIISRRGKATNFKFGRYMDRVHLNKSPLIIWEKRDLGRIQGLPKFFEYPYYLRNA